MLKRIKDHVVDILCLVHAQGVFFAWCMPRASKLGRSVLRAEVLRKRI